MSFYQQGTIFLHSLFLSVLSCSIFLTFHGYIFLNIKLEQTTTSSLRRRGRGLHKPDSSHDQIQYFWLAEVRHFTNIMLEFLSINQSINQSNPVLLKERVRIPRTRRARGAAMLWGRLPLDGVGSCRLFFTDNLHDNISWVPASDKPHTFKSCFTHSSQVFFGRPGPFLPGTGLDLTLFISPLERMTCPNHLSRRSRTRMARSHIPSLACSSSIDGSSEGLTPQILRIIARSLRHSRWRAAEVIGQVSVPCNIELRTLELNRRPLRSKGTGLDVSKGRFSRILPQAHLHLAVAATIQPPPALSMSPR